MGTFTHKGKNYEVDEKGFLQDFDCWDENFAEGMAAKVRIHTRSKKRPCPAAPTKL